MTDAIEELPLARTASEFLSLLRGSNPLWDGDLDSHTGWVFRGQMRASWRLRAAAFRFNGRSDLFRTYCRLYRRSTSNLSAPEWTGWLQPDERPAEIAVELWEKRLSSAGLHALVTAAMVRDFVLLADRAGHPTKVPSFLWHLTNREEHPGALSSYFRGEFAHEDANAFAIAQHHGIPTGFLDWSYNPLVAAFFAAESLVTGTSSSKSEPLAVWAVRTQVFRKDFRELRRLTVTPTQVPFLDAQDGLFTWSPDSYHWFLRKGRYPTFEDLIGSVAWRADASFIRRPLLRKLTLAASEAVSLLKSLWREQVTRAHLMPTFDHVIASLELQAKWKSEAL